MRHSFDWTIEREDADGNGLCYEIEVEGTWRSGSPGSYWEPPDPDEFEIEAVHGLPDGITLTDEEYQKIELWAYENPPEPDYEEYD